MASRSLEDNHKYLLQALSCCTDFKVDYHALCSASDVTNANHAQKRFKTIVEADGDYKLVSGKVILASELPNNDSPNVKSVPKTPKKRKAGDAPGDTTEAKTKKSKPDLANGNDKTKGPAKTKKAQKNPQTFEKHDVDQEDDDVEVQGDTDIKDEEEVEDGEQA